MNYPNNCNIKSLEMCNVVKKSQLDKVSASMIKAKIKKKKTNNNPKPNILSHYLRPRTVIRHLEHERDWMEKIK